MRRPFLFAVIMFSLTASLGAQQPQHAGATAPGNTLLSEDVNNELPHWLRLGAEYRARVEGFTGGGFKPDSEDAYLLSRVRLNMSLLPTSWLKFGFQGQDAHVFGKNQNPAVPPYQDSIDVRQAYVEFGDIEKNRFGVRAGRQELAFGDERLIGNSNWTNTARSFDALRGTVRHGGFRADLFAARVVKLQDSEFDWSTPGNNLYGIYGGIEKLVPKATVEPYFFWRRQSALKTELGVAGISNFGTVGVRWVGKLPSNFDYGTEMDKQAGSLGTDTISAWAGHWVVGKTLPSACFKPRVSVEYNYASGDHNPKDGTRGTFDQLYATAHDKYGLADQVGWRNIRNARAGVDLKLAKKWGLTGRFDAWWLADPHDALYSASSTVVARNTAGTAGSFVGQELDSVLAYTFSKYLQVSGGYGHIFPGTFLNNTTPGESYNFPYASTTLVF
jgi:hypothetical protein